MRAAALLTALTAAAAVVGGPLAARAAESVWQAQVEVAGARIPFRLALTLDGAPVAGHFFDGPRATTPSTGGTYADGKLHLDFASYAASLDGTVTGDRLEAVLTKPGGATFPIHAVLAPAEPASAGPAPSVAGEWIVPVHSEKGEKAWRLIVHQDGVKATASILRIDGDTGALDGVWRDGAFRLSHFAAERPGLLEIRPGADGGLALVLTDGDGRRELVGLKPAVAVARGLVPSDPTKQASVANKSDAFRFAFKDLSGRLVSNTDARFRGKVVVVDVMGSWCPNCHDEAPFLQTLYQKYHGQGLEVVALSFEQGEQVTNPTRLRAFAARYGLTYTVLLAGDRKDVGTLLPQARGLNAWPTTFFLGRDGRVKSTHSGFTSPASGARDIETRREVEHVIQGLLAKKA